MNKQEFYNILGAIAVFTIVIAIGTFLGTTGLTTWGTALAFSAVIIIVNVAGKQLMAHMLDSDVEHRMWTWSRYGFRTDRHFKKPMPAGTIIPLLIALLTWGVVKPMTFLVYETKAKTSRAAKRFGFYSYAEMTDWHNALVGAAGIIAVLILSAVTYFLPGSLEPLARLSAGYAFWNMLPISDLDGTQIFFGSRVLYATLGVITLIFALFAFLVV
jgi:hypothetical protein